MIIKIVQKGNDMEVKLIIDGNESRSITGIIPSEGNVVELIKDGKKKLFNVVLVKYIYDIIQTNSEEYAQEKLPEYYNYYQNNKYAPFGYR